MALRSASDMPAAASIVLLVRPGRGAPPDGQPGGCGLRRSPGSTAPRQGESAGRPGEHLFPCRDRLRDPAFLRKRGREIEARPWAAGLELQRAFERRVGVRRHQAAGSPGDRLAEAGFPRGGRTVETDRIAESVDRFGEPPEPADRSAPARPSRGRRRDWRQDAPRPAPSVPRPCCSPGPSRAASTAAARAGPASRSRRRCPSDQRNSQHRSRAQRARAAAAALPRAGIFASKRVDAKNAPADLGARLVGLRRPDQPPLDLAVELGELVAIDFEVVVAVGEGGLAAAGQRRRTARLAPSVSKAAVIQKSMPLQYLPPGGLPISAAAHLPDAKRPKRPARSIRSAVSSSRRHCGRRCRARSVLDHSMKKRANIGGSPASRRGRAARQSPRRRAADRRLAISRAWPAWRVFERAIFRLERDAPISFTEPSTRGRADQPAFHGRDDARSDRAASRRRIRAEFVARV